MRSLLLSFAAAAFAVVGSAHEATNETTTVPESITGLSAYVGDVRTEAVIVLFFMLLLLFLTLRAIQVYRSHQD